MVNKVIHIYKDSFSGLSRSVWLLSLIMLINRAGAMVLPFMTLYLTKSLHFSLTEAGWVMGAYGTGSILGAYIGGVLTDRYGYYYVQLYSLIFSSFLLSGLIFLSGFYTILLTVFSLSVIADSLRPANSVAIAAYAKPENRTRSFSLMRFAINLGFSIGPAIGGIVAGTLGYKWIFLIDAITCLIAAFILLKYLPFDKTKAPKPKEQSLNKSPSAYYDREYLTFILLVSLWAIAFFQLFTSVPVFWAQEWGFSESKIGLLLALNGLIIVLFEMPVIRSLENYKRYMIMISLGSFFMILSFIHLVIGINHLVPAILFIILISLAEMFAMPFMTNYSVSRPSEDRRGQYMALYAMAYGVAHIVAPLGSLYVADQYSFHTLYIFLVAMSILLTLAFYSLRRRRLAD